MQRILPPHRSVPLFGVSATRAIEARLHASLPEHTLMRRAGLAVARLGLALAPHAQRVWVACGPGNNGGDGLEAAMHWQAAGKAVSVTLLGDASRMPDDAKDALVRAQAAGVEIGNFPAPPLGPHDLAVDALLGIGASRAPDETMAELIAQLNALPCTVLGVDVPSGLDAGTGQPLGDTCVRARHTLTLLTAKPGLFTAMGRDHAGEVWLDELGATASSDAPDAWLTGPAVAATPSRAHAQHKGSFGDVAVVGGAAGMTGAAWLAARAAHACGAGRVYVSLLDGRGLSHDALRPELMVRTEWWKSHDAALNHATVVCGCGGGDAVREPLPRLIGAAERLVLDADALNVVATDGKLQMLLRARADRGRATVLTPHPLEAARLLGTGAAQVQSDRLAAAQELTERFGCVVLLKGSGSVIAAPGETPCINPTGSAALATAGTGDVLAGWLGGLWAQHADATGMQGALRAACAAAFIHGAAADAATGAVLRANDLIEAMMAATQQP
ncbi:NAD(P)H-hydrate dehydratase [Piscinibacter sp.]|uniref:NAD(P)H-hydrate dehydratase n=1 Tax=Piscinibacter sp. TaxID=1903157 RepID=UPI002CEC0824|nr:NAD(P)H-hydrate dehydratase [Albitalea sp.]HUG26529.1 NAD(P)H-hydrate dehydratase [Albitalea sp.]